MTRSDEDRKPRRMLKHTRIEAREIDYWKRLSPDQREYLGQFLLEYYQADFSFEESIHDKDKYKKDCEKRNNDAKKQIHSVGFNLLEESAAKARQKNYQSKGNSSRYYTPEDYMNGFPNAEDFDDEMVHEEGDFEAPQFEGRLDEDRESGI